MWGRTRDEATAAAGPGSPDRSKGMNSLGQPLNLSAEAEAEPEVDAGTTLHYWGVKSRATAIAYTLGYFAPDAPIRYATEIAYPGTPEFAAYKSKTMLGQLPCLTDGEVKVGQSGAILRYLIRKYKIQNHGMISNADQAMSEEMIEMGVELLSMGVKAHYPAAGDRTAAMDELFSAGTDKGKNICVVFGILEATIKDSGFFGSSPMPGDACVASNLRIMSDLQPDCLEKFPKLAALLSKFDSHAGVQKHMANFPYPYLKRASD